MKTLYLYSLTLLTILFANHVDAQTRTITKEIQIVENDGHQKVVITTMDNGTKTTEILEGEAARMYIAKAEQSSSESIVDFSITKADLKAFNAQVDLFAKDVESFVKEINETDVSSSLRSINSKAEQVYSCVKAQLETKE